MFGIVTLSTVFMSLLSFAGVHAQTTSPPSTITSTFTSTSSPTPEPTPETFALGEMLSSSTSGTIIWSPTFNTTSSQCDSPTIIEFDSVYTGPDHPVCNYPFSYGPYTNLSLNCTQYGDIYEGILGILNSTGMQQWTCIRTPLTIPAYTCPPGSTYPNYNLSINYICQ